MFGEKNKAAIISDPVMIVDDNRRPNASPPIEFSLLLER